jgi:c(7)-type cytochrome triheme protein
MKYRLCILISASLLLLHSLGFAVNVRDVVYLPQNTGKVVFSHMDHINKKGLSKNCRACHDALFDLKKKKHFSMADMKKGRSCGACHNGEKSFSLAECATCHQTKDIIFNVKSTGPTRFSHRSHSATSADCGTCHSALIATRSSKRFTMADMANGKSCGACHNGKTAFGVGTCATCHPAKEITYQIKETGPTHFSHKIHLAAAQCGQCHPKLYFPHQKNRRVGMAAMEKGKSCGACHNGKHAFSVKDCSKCHPVRELVFVDKDAGNVTFSHTSHSSLYGCGDCHTSIYETTHSKPKVTMQEMEKGKSCGSCHDGKSAFSVKEKCESCHKM